MGVNLKGMLHRLAFLFIFMGPVSAHARSLDWNESVRLAEENNAALKSAEATYRSTAYLETVARAGYLPEMNAALTGTRSSSAGGGARAGEFAVSPGNQYAATLSGQMNLFAGLADQANLARAVANARAAAEVYRSARAQASTQLKSAYEGLIYAQNVRILAEDIVRRRENNLGLVRLRFESGRENKGSVLLSRAYLNQAKYESLQAEHGEAVARFNLARVVGLDETAETLIASSPVPRSPPPERPEFRKIALTTPEHLQAAAQEDAADAAIGVARSGFLPRLGLSGTYGRRDTEFWPDGPDRWTLGLTLSISIFNGLRDYGEIKSASAMLAASTGNRVEVDRGLLVSLRSAHNAYVQAVAKEEVDASFRDAAQTRAEIARTKYNNGLLTFEDWDLIENDLISRQKAYLQSVRDRVVAEAGWEQALGIGVFQ